MSQTAQWKVRAPKAREKICTPSLEDSFVFKLSDVLICMFPPHFDRNSLESLKYKCLRVTMRGPLLGRKGGAKLNYYRDGASCPPLAPQICLCQWFLICEFLLCRCIKHSEFSALRKLCQENSQHCKKR